MNEEIKNLLGKAKDVAVSAAETTGQAINAAGRKANAVFDMARNNMQINDVKNDIGKRFKDIGALVYRTHVKPETSSDGLAKKLEELDKLHAKLAELEKNAEDFKTKAKCPVCGNMYGKADTFCRSCGHALRGETPSDSDGSDE